MKTILKYENKPKLRPVLSAFAENFKVVDILSIAEFAEKHIYNPSNASEKGKFDIDRVPYQREVFEAMTPGKGTNKVTLMWGAQLGKTYSAMIWQAYLVFYGLGNIINYLPTAGMGKIFSKQKLDTFIDSNPELIPMFGRRSLATKMFKGFTLNIRSAATSSSFRMESAPFIYLDETDDFETLDEGHPLELVKSRSNSFGRFAVRVQSSTPDEKDTSVIYKEFLRGTQEYYFIPCPCCGNKQTLVLDNFKYQTREVDKRRVVIKESVYYQCAFCDEKITENFKTQMLAGGEWRATNPDPEEFHRSFQLSSFYVPDGWFPTWADCLQQYEDGKTDEDTMRTFWNTKLGLPFESNSYQPDHLRLYELREDFEMFTVPSEVVRIYAGVDVQKNRLEYQIVGVGEEAECWIAAYGVVPGSPLDLRTWNALDEIMRKPLKHGAGIDMPISLVAVDSGYESSSVYDFCRLNDDLYFATKGAKQEFDGYMRLGKVMDKDAKTKKVYDDSLQLYLINTQLIKKYIYSSLSHKLKQEDDLLKGIERTSKRRLIHFAKDLPLEYFEMLTSEKMYRKKINGSYIERFEKPTEHTRNEALDTLVYAFALMFDKNTHRLFGQDYQKIWNSNVANKVKRLQKKEEKIKQKAQEIIGIEIEKEKDVKLVEAEKRVYQRPSRKKPSGANFLRL